MADTSEKQKYAFYFYITEFLYFQERLRLLWASLYFHFPSRNIIKLHQTVDVNLIMQILNL